MKKKVSVCVTTFNEEKTVGKLLKSLSKQTVVPSEVVIVDGGSTDKTFLIIKNFESKVLKIKLFKLEGANISEGRNEAIKKAKFDITCQIDGGCVANKDWLEKLIEPFSDPGVQIVAGFYEMVFKNSLERCFTVFLGVLPNSFDEKRYLPSARSVAFRRSVWKKLGGFNEKLTLTGEDTEFFRKAQKMGLIIVRVKEARVHWKVPEDIFSFSKKIFWYARGDGEIDIVNKKIYLIYLRYVALFILFVFWKEVFLIVVVLYLIYSFLKVYGKTNDILAGVYGMGVQIMVDLLVMGGFLSGKLKR